MVKHKLAGNCQKFICVIVLLCLSASSAFERSENKSKVETSHILHGRDYYDKWPSLEVLKQKSASHATKLYKVHPLSNILAVTPKTRKTTATKSSEKSTSERIPVASKSTSNRKKYKKLFLPGTKLLLGKHFLDNSTNFESKVSQRSVHFNRVGGNRPPEVLKYFENVKPHNISVKVNSFSDVTFGSSSPDQHSESPDALPSSRDKAGDTVDFRGIRTTVTKNSTATRQVSSSIAPAADTVLRSSLYTTKVFPFNIDKNTDVLFKTIHLTPAFTSTVVLSDITNTITIAPNFITNITSDVTRSTIPVSNSDTADEIAASKSSTSSNFITASKILVPSTSNSFNSTGSTGSVPIFKTNIPNSLTSSTSATELKAASETESTETEAVTTASTVTTETYSTTETDPTSTTESASTTETDPTTTTESASTTETDSTSNTESTSTTETDSTSTTERDSTTETDSTSTTESASTTETEIASTTEAVATTEFPTAPLTGFTTSTTAIPTLAADSGLSPTRESGTTTTTSSKTSLDTSLNAYTTTDSDVALMSGPPSSTNSAVTDSVATGVFMYTKSTESINSTDENPLLEHQVKKEPVVRSRRAALSAGLFFLCFGLVLLLIGVYAIYKISKCENREDNVRPYAARRFTDE